MGRRHAGRCNDELAQGDAFRAGLRGVGRATEHDTLAFFEVDALTINQTRCFNADTNHDALSCHGIMAG
jgi:hypothetical protein